MCIACREFVKEALTLPEFQRALGEISREDVNHLNEVESAVRSSGGDTGKLREKLVELLPD